MGGKKENSCWAPKTWTCFHFLTLDSRHTLMTDATCLTTDGHNSCAAPDLQPKHTHVAFVIKQAADTQTHVCFEISMVGQKRCVFLHIYWTNNTVKYMSACGMCVCMCVWVTELLLADWRWSLEERPEPLRASTPQPVQNEQENVRLF